MPHVLKNFSAGDKNVSVAKKQGNFKSCHRLSLVRQRKEKSLIKQTLRL